MVFEHIEQLKKQYTDKYVVVDESRPELLRFRGQTGLVKTVNMNGRALVEFDKFLNIGWYDIELDYLKVIDKPLEAEEPPKKTAKPAAAAKPAAKKPAAMSVEEMLAAARANKSESAPAKPAASAPAAAATAPAETKKAAGSMSVEEMLAAARANKPTAGAAAPPPAPAPAPEPAAAAPKGDIPTTIPEIIAYCRKAAGS